MKKLFSVFLLGICINAFSQDFVPYYKYRVYLTDKKNSEFSVRHPEAYLSKRAIQRRKRQGLKIDRTDLPVSSVYINEIRAIGVGIINTSKWNNTVVVSCIDTTIMSKVVELSFVDSVCKAAYYARPDSVTDNNRCKGLADADSLYDNTYGLAYSQISQLNGIALHDAGFKGDGMSMAVIDGGFFNADVLPGFANTKILGVKDFVNPRIDFYATQPHGSMVLSSIGANRPHFMVGTAPEASFWLIRSEDTNTEQLVEEDNWAAAIEFADSVGVDVVNSSIGYIKYDDGDNVKYYELDGHTHLISRSASMAASKGMILCNSAGNSGVEEWKKISVPADADNVLTVGAVTAKGNIAIFSSIGNSADGRVKPDVVAKGQESAVYGNRGAIIYSMGTSFSSPILSGMVTCLWQALPNLTAYEIMDIVRKSGDRFEHPDNIYGYGIPDFFKAYIIGLTYNK